MIKLNNDILEIELPQGKNQSELVKILRGELIDIHSVFYGKDIKINGRCTTAMALFLGHNLAHICKSVSIFDPKENAYVKVISH